MEIPLDKKPLRPGHLLLAIALFCAFFAASYPYYRYFVDPDAVAYLTMAKRATEGDAWRLVNALWSPLHPALVAVCVRLGVNDVLAMQLTNGLACVLILIAVYLLFRRFAAGRFAGGVLLAALAFFLVYALYKQSFCDLWQIAILLFYLGLMTAPDFLRKPGKWLLCAILMAFAAYAKVYSFYFLLLQFPLALLLIKKPSNRSRFPLRTYVVVMLLQVLLLSPLVWLQHQKYGGWGLSKSGALNTSWLLTGHKTHKRGITALVPPPYPNSPYTWEDPWLAEGTLHTRFESLKMVKSSAAHVVLAAAQGVKASAEISPFLLVVFAGGLLVVLFKSRQRIFGANYKILLASAVILPLGYFLQHFEARYIWLLLPVCMIIGTRMLVAFGSWTGSERAYRMAVAGFALSFMAYPVYDLQKLFRAGEDVYREAKLLNSMGITGNFTSNDNPSRSGELAYWLNGHYYTPTRTGLGPQEVLADMRRYGIKYYLSYKGPFDVATPVLQDEAGRPYPEISRGRIEGLKVFMVE